MRKQHLHVEQETILHALQEVGPSPLRHIADHFDISEATATRQLRGLVSQGKIQVVGGGALSNPDTCFEATS